MKMWAWIVGGLGAAAGAWWFLAKREQPQVARPVYPENITPGETPGYPLAPSADELPPDVEGGFMSSVGQQGESYVSTPVVSTSQQPTSQESSASQSASFAMGTHSSSYGQGSTQSTSQGTAPTSTTKTSKVNVITYASPTTSKTSIITVPLQMPVKSAPIKTSVQPKKSGVSVPLKPLRGVYAIGADHTEAEYKAMAARAELESKRREWAANQMAEKIAAINCLR